MPKGIPKKSDSIEALEIQVKTLTLALGKIATLTGNGNHLKEFGIEKWVPTKEEMGKKYD